MPVELRAHTAFSFGDGAITPEALARKAAELGYHSIGITDNADIGGIVRFCLEAKRAGIRPVVGVELNVDGHPVGLIARTAEGYRNIASLVPRARLHSDFQRGEKGQNEKRRGRPGFPWKDVAERGGGV